MKTKKAQSEIITTILLILIGIAAVAILSAFVINMVRNNLKGTDCFDVLGQLKINIDNDWTYYNITGKTVYLNIERETRDFNLTALNIVYGDAVGTNKITLKPGTVSGISYLNGATATSTLVLPQAGESKTYIIDASSFGRQVTKVIIAPVLINNIECDKSDEKNIPAK